MRKSDKYKIKNKPTGFTLTELVVVIALLALVSGLITTIVIMVDRHEKNIEESAATESELIQAENAFTDFLMNFDKSDTSIRVTKNRITVDEKYYLDFSDGVLNCIATEEFKIVFEFISNIEFTVPESNLVCCKMILLSGNSCKSLYLLKANNNITGEKS